MAAECVVLIHGFGRSSFSLSKIKNRLEDNGYKTILPDYPSRKYNIEQLTNDYVIPIIEQEAKNCSKLHFVGYSMGGIITRFIITKKRPANLGKVVFLAAPNSGAEVIESFNKYSWFRRIFGPAIDDITPNASFINNLPKYVDYEAGVIAGRLSANPITSLLILEGEDDGTVSVESTKIDGMKEHIILNSTHSTLLNSEIAAEQIENFISNGNFFRR
jgi:triacylglycerol lipase